MITRKKYLEETESITREIRKYRKEYGLSDFDLDSVSSISFSAYSEKLESLKLENIDEKSRRKKIALLEIGLLKEELREITDKLCEHNAVRY